jgi:hypothetical protein
VNRRSLRHREKRPLIEKVRDAFAVGAPKRREDAPVFGHI